MSNGKFGPPAPLRGPDYEQIEAAVMETARGRWFLAEFARRNRTADTETLLKAIQRLQNAVAPRQDTGDVEDMRANIVDIATAIAQLRHDLFSDHDASEDRGTRQELSVIAAQIEEATHKILQIGERVQEVAWTLREQGIGAGPCDTLDSCAAEIFTACAFQDLTGQKMARLTGLLRMIEERLTALIDRTGLDDIILREAPGHPDPAPGSARGAEAGGAGHSRRPLARHVTQIEIDALLAADQPFEPGPGEEIVFVDREEEPDFGAPDREPESRAPDSPANPIEGAPAERFVAGQEDGEDDDDGPAPPPQADGDSDTGAFDRLTADLRAATGMGNSAVAAGPAIPPAALPSPAGVSGTLTVHEQDLAFTPDRPSAGKAAKAPANGQAARGIGQVTEAGSGDPTQTNWDAEFNRLSPAHRMALFS